MLSPLQELLAELVERHRPDDRGEVATYIPELGKADPNWFGLVLVTADGAVYEAGDSRVPFTIQSISKPLSYGLALQRAGMQEVRRRVGVEPSGEAFNSISLRPGTGTPLNPMINAGALAINSLIREHAQPDPLEQLLSWFGNFTGHEMSIDQKVYESERDTGHRNRAIAHLLRNFDLVSDPVEECLDLYFKQCSILVTCRDLAMIAATLANQGVQPVTQTRALEPHLVDDLLSVMTTCGMYDYAGEWLYDVGLPAKSGVTGGIMAVLPGRMGIGLFSPRLDPQGNSVRGIAACKELSERFGLHLFSNPRASRSALRRELTLSRHHSTRVRSNDESNTLRTRGSQARILELHGDLEFSGLEVVQRHAWAALSDTRLYLLDLTRLDTIHVAAGDGLVRLVRKLRDAGRQVVLAAAPQHAQLSAAFLARCNADAHFTDVDIAIEACEQSLLHNAPLSVGVVHHAVALAAVGAGGADASVDDGSIDVMENPPERPLELAQLEVAGGMSAEELVVLDHLAQRLSYDANEQIFRRGDKADNIYFLTQGRVSVRIYEADGVTYKRLAAFSPGHVFGEMSVIDTAARSADVWTETPVVCLAISLAAIDHLTTHHPAIKIKLLQHLLRVLTTRLRMANDQLVDATNH